MIRRKKKLEQIQYTTTHHDIKNKKKNNYIYWIIFFAFILSLIMFVLAIYLKSLMILEEKNIYASLKISDKGGFDVNTSALTMGTLRPGDSSLRPLFIENNYDIPIEIEFIPKGNISKFLKFDKDIFLEPGKNITLNVNAVVSRDEPFGFYDGNVTVIFKRAK
jgi:hypothetical protein